MNKRGQFYIFVSVILALAIFVVVSQVNTLEERILLEDFNELSKNFATEAPKSINKILSTATTETKPEDIGGTLDATFTNNFVKYARTQDPNIGFIYIYKITLPPTTGGTTVQELYYIANYLPGTSTAKVCTEDFCQVLPSSTDESINNIKLNIGGQTFKQNVPTELRTFGLGTSSSTDPITKIEIGEITYDVGLTGVKNLKIIGRSEDKAKEVTSIFETY